jgi:Ca2+-binding RTX toxin-like protein
MATVPKRLALRVLPALAAACAAIALAATIAQGATVEVGETLGEENFGVLSFQAGAGEDNRLTIAFAKAGDGYLDLTVKDEGAALTVAAGCSGGGGPGEVAHCRMHEPKQPDLVYCGKVCEHTIPGTGWRNTLRIFLGDGDNVFDGGAFPRQSLGFAMDVASGAGNDEITLGGANDEVDPGAGNDRVHTGPGSDRIETTAAPDGPDLYDSGRTTDASADTISYAGRGVPIDVAAPVAGASGEGDLLVGSFEIIGGMADDVIAGGPENEKLYGGPGNDVIVGNRVRGTELYGGPGDDRLSTATAAAESSNLLIGEGGNDSYLGGKGHDEILDSLDVVGEGSPEAAPGPPKPGEEDAAYGGARNDTIMLGAGPDRILGGPGDDLIDGENGNDSLFGGPGRDALVGGHGFDRVFGGRGADQLFSGRTPWPAPVYAFPKAVDDGRDRVDCGPGRDIGLVNPWDRRSRCEKTLLLQRRAAADR